MTSDKIYPCPFNSEVPEFYREFLEQLINAQMKYYASEIFNLLELETERQFTDALEKTIQTLHLAGIPAEHHIRPVYADYRGEVIVDYKMTPLAFGLIGMHAEPLNQTLAGFKIRWAGAVIKQMKNL